MVPFYHQQLYQYSFSVHILLFDQHDIWVHLNVDQVLLELHYQIMIWFLLHFQHLIMLVLWYFVFLLFLIFVVNLLDELDVLQINYQSMHVIVVVFNLTFLHFAMSLYLIYYYINCLSSVVLMMMLWPTICTTIKGWNLLT